MPSWLFFLSYLWNSICWSTCPGGHLRFRKSLGPRRVGSSICYLWSSRRGARCWQREVLAPKRTPTQRGSRAIVLERGVNGPLSVRERRLAHKILSWVMSVSQLAHRPCDGGEPCDSPAHHDHGHQRQRQTATCRHGAGDKNMRWRREPADISHPQLGLGAKRRDLHLNWLSICPFEKKQRADQTQGLEKKHPSGKESAEKITESTALGANKERKATTGRRCTGHWTLTF